MQTTRSFHPNTDRYVFDFKLCPSARGWAQFDTRQDASYFGNWINPFERKLVNFAEGDLAITVCDSDEEFAAELAARVAWCRERDDFVGLDPGFNEPLAAKLAALGYGPEPQQQE